MNEDKIEVGEYVRTKSGIIGTLIEILQAGSGIRYAGEFITDTIISIYTRPHTEVRIKENDLARHSKNIIDLIEEGDYVNGHLVIDKKDDEERIEIAIESDHIIYYWIEEKNIKSIVTKEQFERVQYEV